jgi:hypothetical protein
VRGGILPPAHQAVCDKIAGLERVVHQM